MTETLNHTGFLLCSKREFKSERLLWGILDNFEQSKLYKPEKCGIRDGKLLPYEITEFISAILNFEKPDPVFKRTRKINYKCVINLDENTLQKIEYFATQKDDLKSFFDLAARVASEVQPEYGVANLIWRDGKGTAGPAARISAGIGLKCSEIRDFGPNGLGQRNWFGQHIVELIGKDRLKRSGAILSETSWGAIQVDILEKPWEASFRDLYGAHERVFSVLAESKIFGDYSHPIRKSGVHWTPIPF